MTILRKKNHCKAKRLRILLGDLLMVVKETVLDHFAVINTNEKKKKVIGRTVPVFKKIQHGMSQNFPVT